MQAKEGVVGNCESKKEGCIVIDELVVSFSGGAKT